MKQKTILICDDDESILGLLSVGLQLNGFCSICETNSLHLVAGIEKQQPDLLLLDLWMPLLNGMQVLRILKAHPVTRPLPVILISGSLEGIAGAKEEGAAGFLAKPIALDLLVRQLNLQLGW